LDTTVLIVDDNRQFRESLRRNLEAHDILCREASCAAEALACCKNDPPDVCLLDIMLGDQSGLDLLPRLLKARKDLPVIVITGYASIESAIEAIKRGACDYIQKPVKFEALLKKVASVVKLARLAEENLALKERISDLAPRIVSEDPRVLTAVERLDKLAGTDIPILIVGESGTGKEVFADYAHYRSSRSSGRFLKINCAAFPESLLDNELFGHEKGAYTGADSVFKGVFEKAQGGTLFMDEIGDMGVNIQSKILRVIQNREIRRLGGDETISVNARFIAATNKRLESLIEEGRFREDLFYRLNTATVEIPPLRERACDIPLLTAHFIEEYSRENRKSIEGASPEVLAAFLAYGWPGNVRELKNVTMYACALCSSERITSQDMPASFAAGARRAGGDGAFREAERALLEKTLQRVSGNKKRAAEELSISRSTLYSKLRKHGIDR
jgi:DNA-binding NtrC family response regulator